MLNAKEATMYRKVGCTTCEFLQKDRMEQLDIFDEIKEEVDLNEMKVEELKKLLQ